MCVCGKCVVLRSATALCPVVDKKPVPGLDNTSLAEIARGNAADMWGDWSDELRAAGPAPKL